MVLKQWQIHLSPMEVYLPFSENAFIKGVVIKKMALQNFNGVFLNEKEKREREESTC